MMFISCREGHELKSVCKIQRFLNFGQCLAQFEQTMIVHLIRNKITENEAPPTGSFREENAASKLQSAKLTVKYCRETQP